MAALLSEASDQGWGTECRKKFLWEYVERAVLTGKNLCYIRDWTTEDVNAA